MAYSAKQAPKGTFFLVSYRSKYKSVRPQIRKRLRISLRLLCKAQ